MPLRLLQPEEREGLAIYHLGKTIFAFFVTLQLSLCAASAFAGDEIERSACITALSLEHDSDQVLKTAIDTEKEFAANYLKKAAPDQSWFRFLPGHRKILILAPHATSQIRENAVKIADSGTGSLAVILNRLTGAPVLYSFFQSPIDPNYYDSSPFKQKITELVKTLKPDLVLDLHTSARSRPYDVDFGTQLGKSLINHAEYLTELKSALAQQGITQFSDNFFSANKNETDTKWVSKLGTPCIQLEINRAWLLPSDQPEEQRRFLKLVRGLVKFSAGFKN